MLRLPYQENDGGIVALLPDGRVEFLVPSCRPILDELRAGTRAHVDGCLDPYVVTDPLVQLDGFHLAAPAIVFVETTNLCNLRCTHCYADSGLRRKSEIATETVLALLDELDEIGVLQVFLTGGELFAHPDALAIVKHARSKSFSTQIFTNGLLVTEEALAELPEGTSFFVSFDTADPARTVRGKMDFPTLGRLFRAMERHGHVYRTAISVHRRNLDDCEEIFEWCAANGHPRPQWLETHPVGRALLHPDILLRPEQIEHAVAVYRRCMDRFVSDPAAETADDERGDGAARRIRSIDTVKFCQRLEAATRREKCARSVAYVTSAGDVYPCSNCMSREMYGGGNLRTARFAEIWREGFDEIRSITFDDHRACDACPVARAGIWCQFRCPPLAANVSGSRLGCGATEYVKLFMQRAHEYWEERRRQDKRLTLVGRPAARG